MLSRERQLLALCTVFTIRFPQKKDMSLTIDQQIGALARRCERILNEQELRRKLERSAATGRPLRIKLGMDPTAPDVTLGHAVPLQVVRQFQDFGPKPVLITGDYTRRVVHH